jgi:hypothetical protein
MLPRPDPRERGRRLRQPARCHHGTRPHVRGQWREVGDHRPRTPGPGARTPRGPPGVRRGRRRGRPRADRPCRRRPCPRRPGAVRPTGDGGAGRRAARRPRPRRRRLDALHLGHDRPPQGRATHAAFLSVGGCVLLVTRRRAVRRRHHAVRAAAVPLLRPRPVRPRGVRCRCDGAHPSQILHQPGAGPAGDRPVHGAAGRPDHVPVPHPQGERAPEGRLRQLPAAVRVGGRDHGRFGERRASGCWTAMASPRPPPWSP